MAVMLVNNAVSRLAASVAPDALALSVSAGDGGKFPTPGVGDWFPLTLIRADGVREIVRCTGRTGDVLTVVRAQEGTGAVPLASGDRVELRLTVGALNTIFGGATALPTFGSLELKSVTPYVDFHAGNSADDYTSRIIAETAAVLVIKSLVKEQARFNDFGMIVQGDVVATGAASVVGPVNRAGGGVVSFIANRTDSPNNSWYQAQTTAGSVYFGNIDGTGFGIGNASSLSWANFRNGAASVNGSFYAAGTLQTGASIIAAGNITANAALYSAGNVYSGNGAAAMAADGNIVGPVWGGFLTAYLPANYTQRGNIGFDIATWASAAGGLGTYAQMIVGGGATSPGQLVAGGNLKWAAAGFFIAASPGGTWKIMGAVRNGSGNGPENVTVCMRIA